MVVVVVFLAATVVQAKPAVSKGVIAGVAIGAAALAAAALGGGGSSSSPAPVSPSAP
jgi:type IV secretory pathway TrbL component